MNWNLSHVTEDTTKMSSNRGVCACLLLLFFFLPSLSITLGSLIKVTTSTGSASSVLTSTTVSVTTSGRMAAWRNSGVDKHGGTNTSVHARAHTYTHTHNSKDGMGFSANAVLRHYWKHTSGKLIPYIPGLRSPRKLDGESMRKRASAASIVLSVQWTLEPPCTDASTVMADTHQKYEMNVQHCV